MDDIHRKKVLKGFRKCINKAINKRLKELGLDKHDFCQKMLGRDVYKPEEIESEVYKLHMEYYGPERNISLKVIKKIEEELGIKYGKARVKCEELLNLWIRIEAYRKRDKFKPFVYMEEENLFWITNNLDKLLDIQTIHVIFWGYLSLLNDKGKKELKDAILYIHDRLKFKKIETSVEINFIGQDDFIIKDKLDCFMKIEACEKFWNIESPEDRKCLINTWMEYQGMDDMGMEIYELFINYGSRNSNKMTSEQLVITAIVVLLIRDRRYVKI